MKLTLVSLQYQQVIFELNISEKRNCILVTLRVLVLLVHTAQASHYMFARDRKPLSNRNIDIELSILTESRIMQKEKSIPIDVTCL